MAAPAASDGDRGSHADIAAGEMIGGSVRRAIADAVGGGR